jgi:hypothetical protein
VVVAIDIERRKNRLLKFFFMCPLLASASKGKLLLFFSFFVAAAIDSTTEANKAPLSSLYSLDVSGGSSVVEHLPHHLKVEGLSP